MQKDGYKLKFVDARLHPTHRTVLGRAFTPVAGDMFF